MGEQRGGGDDKDCIADCGIDEQGREPRQALGWTDPISHCYGL